MKTIDIIHDEHRALASVLKGLRFVVDELSAGRLAPDFRLLSSMVDYVTQLPDRLHHPKEDDFLFPALKRRSPEAAALIEELEDQHRKGYGLTIDLLRALVHYQSVGEAGLADFARVAREHVELTFAHLNKEEGELMPMARTALTPEDWAEVDAAFALNFDPYGGADGEFRDLFHKIVSLTPAPYGLG